MLKANDVAGQLHRFIPSPSTVSSCFPTWQRREKRPAGICRFYVVITFCLIKMSFTLFFYFALVSLVPRSSHRFSSATILNIISKEGWRFRSRDLLCPRVFFPAATILKNQKNLGTRLTVNPHLSFSLAFFSFLSFSYLRNFIGTRARTLQRVVTPLKIQKN